MNKELIQGLTNELDSFWMELVQDLKASMVRQKIYASGVTAQSIGDFNTKPVTITAKGIKVTLGMPKHYIYLDRGVDGALSSRGALPTSDGRRFAYKTRFYSNVVNDSKMQALERRLMQKFGSLVTDIVEL